MVFWKKQSQIEEMIEHYLQASEGCLKAFGEAMDVYFASGVCPELEQKVLAVREGEWAADQQRRKVEDEMFGQALIPELRGDVLRLLEALDRVPNECEEIAQDLWLQGVRWPEELQADLQELVRVNVEANECLCEVVRQLFADASEVVPAADRVIGKEQRADEIERRLIKTIFDSPRDLAEKLLLRQIVSGIADIADRAEDASDLVRIVAVKQQA